MQMLGFSMQHFNAFLLLSSDNKEKNQSAHASIQSRSQEGAVSEQHLLFAWKSKTNFSLSKHIPSFIGTLNVYIFMYIAKT